MFWKKKEEKTSCLHSWSLTDFDLLYVNNGIEVESEEVYVISCIKCNRQRKIDRYVLNKMRELSLVRS